MDKEIKAKWVPALRSGKYQQCQGLLKHADGNDQCTFCCIGVLVDVMELGWEVHDPYSYKIASTVASVTNLTPEAMLRAGLTVEQESELVDMNDSGMASFDEIADWIEDYL